MGNLRSIDSESISDDGPKTAKVVLLVVIVAAAFGPYLTAGIRTEQLTVYGIFLVVLLLCRWPQLEIGICQLLVMALMSTQIIVALAGWALPPTPNPIRGAGDAVSGLDNVSLPLAVVAVVWTIWGRSLHREKYIGVICMVVVCAACINTVAAYMSMLTDLTTVLSPFWSNDAIAGSLAATRIVQMERYSGIFNQPAEGGEFYSIALLAGIYSLRKHALLLTAVSAMIVVGGLLTVSKVFLFVGLPLGVWAVLAMPGRRSHRYTVLSAMFMAGIVAALMGTALMPTEIHLPMQFFGGQEASLQLYTAGRLGGRGTVSGDFGLILDYSPWTGYGAKGIGIPYDNGWLEAMAIGGLIGVVAYTLIFVALVFAWVKRRKAMTRADSIFSVGLLTISVGASIGLPGTTANRVATVLWLLISFLLFAQGRSSVDLKSVRDSGAAG